MKTMILVNILFGCGLMWAMCACGGAADERITRAPAVSGLFYPSDGEELREVVSGHLAAVGDLPDINGRIIALICPHAGLVYSGQIAAYSYKLLENSGVNRVILCGPSHRYPFEGISVWGPQVTWQTPIGDVTCDDAMCAALIDASPHIGPIAKAHAQEHCLEVQLPYLQTVLDDFTIVPALMGSPRPETIQTLADALSGLDFDEHTVLVASTDWQHYLPAEQGRPLDSAGMDCLEHLDPDRLQDYLAQKKTQACGGGTTVAVMRAAMAHGADRVKILKYGDSGDVTGDKSSVVSYVAAVLYKEEDSDELSAADQKKLLKIARQSIETYLKTGAIPSFDVPESLRRPGAAFVTLEKDERLRGCIGRTEAVTPLYETVSYCAVQAAMADPRFPAVQPAEMRQIHIEISVLTPLKKVTSLEEITVGRDGLLISMGANRGLLLPQVATDYGWDRTTFLEHTCRKAGLPLDAYRSEQAEIFIFQAIIFGE